MTRDSLGREKYMLGWWRHGSREAHEFDQAHARALALAGGWPEGKCNGRHLAHRRPSGRSYGMTPGGGTFGQPKRISTWDDAPDITFAQTLPVSTMVEVVAPKVQPLFASFGTSCLST